MKKEDGYETYFKTLADFVRDRGVYCYFDNFIFYGVYG